ncbi:LLM class flavin-dependent oxidoreductase [Streptomyces sp. NPDC050147]|uniref:LLM class flavin-dependent oxidoreductase n=1 Tax=Streptomyces sp. NPDC050147 TaxID=3155513 RepID=UPI00341689AC
MPAELRALSVFHPAPPHSLEAMTAFGTFARRRGVRRLWIGQSLHVESQLALAGLAARLPGLPLGTAVALAPLRHPYQAAVEARSLGVMSGVPYVAGYGPGALDLQQRLLAAPYDHPLRAMGDYVSVMRRLLDGEAVEHRGEYHTTRYELPSMPGAPKVEVGLGVLRPGMARTAGQVADVAITWLAPYRYIGQTLMPALQRGATEKGRQAPRIASVVHAAVRKPGRRVAEAALAAVGPHLRSLHYSDMLRRAGVAVDPADPERGAAALVDSDAFVSGTPDEIADQLRRYREHGVDEIIVNVSGVLLTEGARAALSDLDAIIGAYGDGETAGGSCPPRA